jgi:hypothetical protein
MYYIYMSEVPRQNPLEQSIYTLKDKKVRQVLPGSGYQWKGKRKG